MTTDDKGAISRDSALLTKLARAIRDAHEERDFIRPSLSDAAEIERIAAILATQPAQAVSTDPILWQWQNKLTGEWCPCSDEGHADFMKHLLHDVRALGVIAPVPADDALDDLVPVELIGVADVLTNGGGFWRPRSGCHETEDGHPTAKYTYSPHFRCALGGGCSECGGIGAIWDCTDYADRMANLDAPEPVHASDASARPSFWDVFEAGFGLRSALLGHVFDGRDVGRLTTCDFWPDALQGMHVGTDLHIGLTVSEAIVKLKHEVKRRLIAIDAARPAPAVDAVPARAVANAELAILRDVAKEYDELIRHMDAGGDFNAFMALVNARDDAPAVAKREAS